MRMPPRAMSLNRTWKPWNLRPTTKNTPKGTLSMSGLLKKELCEAEGHRRLDGEEEVRPLHGVHEGQRPAHDLRLLDAEGRGGEQPLHLVAGGLHGGLAARRARVEAGREKAEQVVDDVGPVQEGLLDQALAERVPVDVGLDRAQDPAHLPVPAEALGEQPDVGVGHADELVHEQHGRVQEVGLGGREPALLHLGGHGPGRVQARPRPAARAGRRGSSPARTGWR